MKVERGKLDAILDVTHSEVWDRMKVGVQSNTSSEAQGQIVGTSESLNGLKNLARRKEKKGEKCCSRRSLLFFVPYIFFRPFRLSLAPFICPWISEDESNTVSLYLWSITVTVTGSVTWHPKKRLRGRLQPWQPLSRNVQRCATTSDLITFRGWNWVSSDALDRVIGLSSSSFSESSPETNFIPERRAETYRRQNMDKSGHRLRETIMLTYFEIIWIDRSWRVALLVRTNFNLPTTLHVY